MAKRRVYSLSCGEIAVDIVELVIEGAKVDELKKSQLLALSMINEG